MQELNCQPGCREWHNVTQAARILGRSRRHLYRLMKEGVIPWKRKDYGRGLRHDDLEEYKRARMPIR